MSISAIFQAIERKYKQFSIYTNCISLIWFDWLIFGV